MLAIKRKNKNTIEKPKVKTPKQMERHLKGVANHRRIEILFIVADNDGIMLDGICDNIKGNVKTISEHTKKLVQSGLINKSRRGRGIGHSLSPYGKRFSKFIKSF